MSSATISSRYGDGSIAADILGNQVVERPPLKRFRENLPATCGPMGDKPPTADDLAVAEALGQRVAEVTAQLARGRKG